MKPITPDEVVSAKRDSLPQEVLEAFNEMIASSWNGSYSHFKTKEVVAVILEKMNYGKITQPIIKSDELFENHWLDVEDIYRKAGWKVVYDNPAYNETYDATYKFSKPSGRDTPMPGGYI